MYKNSLLLTLVLSLCLSAFSQDDLPPNPPLFKGYKDLPGNVNKNHYFNYIKLKDERGEKERQATGYYWEVSYSYDSIFRQKAMFADFMEQQIKNLGGVLFWHDTTQIHFAVPREDAHNLWGKVLLTSDRVYRLKLIEERSFVNKVDFSAENTVAYDPFVDSIEMPPLAAFLPNSVIERGRYSKFNHMSISFTANNVAYRQSLMGPYWDLKLYVADQEGETDKRISTVEIMESYYRAALKMNGTILKSRPRELVFHFPYGENQKLYYRVMTSLDGIYYLKIILQNNEDEKEPESAVAPKESIRG